LTVPWAQGGPWGLGLAQARQQSDADQGVAQEAGHDGRPDQRLQFLDMEAVHDGAQGKGSGRQRHGGDDVKRDPQTPGVDVIQVGGDTQAEDEAHRSCQRAHHNQGDHEFEEIMVAFDFIYDNSCGSGHRSPSLVSGVDTPFSSSCSRLRRSLRWLNQDKSDSEPPTARKMPGTRRSACQV